MFFSALNLFSPLSTRRDLANAACDWHLSLTVTVVLELGVRKRGGSLECLCAWNGVCMHEILDSIVREILFENATFERSERASYIYYMEISGRRLFQIETKVNVKVLK